MRLASMAAGGGEKFRVLQLRAAHEVEKSSQSGSREGGGQLELLLGAQGLLFQLPYAAHTGGQMTSKISGTGAHEIMKLFLLDKALQLLL